MKHCSVSFQRGHSGPLVGLHEPGIAGNVRRQDRSELLIYLRVRHGASSHGPCYARSVRASSRSRGIPNPYGLLTPIYGWFTEGFDTADQKEAKALLEELK